jgi:hypothetical protein
MADNAFVKCVHSTVHLSINFNIYILTIYRTLDSHTSHWTHEKINKWQINDFFNDLWCHLNGLN